MESSLRSCPVMFSAWLSQGIPACPWNASPRLAPHSVWPCCPLPVACGYETSLSREAGVQDAAGPIPPGPGKAKQGPWGSGKATTTSHPPMQPPSRPPSPRCTDPSRNSRENLCAFGGVAFFWPLVNSFVPGFRKHLLAGSAASVKAVFTPRLSPGAFRSPEAPGMTSGQRLAGLAGKGGPRAGHEGVLIRVSSGAQGGACNKCGQEQRMQPLWPPLGTG